LKERLKSLFQSSLPQIETDVQRLWDQRCEASHQAIAFDPKLEGDLPLLEKLFLGIFVFAVDRLDKASTVSQLWDCADKYKLPGFVLLDPPDGMIRTRFRDVIISTNIKANNTGRRFDAAFQESAKLVDGHLAR
jgi:hypothetical protein